MFDQATLWTTFGTPAVPGVGTEVDGEGVTQAVRGRGELFADYPLL